MSTRWPSGRSSPDVVERAVYGEDQRHRRDHQNGKARHAQLAGLGGELRQIAQHLARDGFGDQAVDQPAFQHDLHAREDGERREQRQRHREERHQGQHRGEGQAAGGHAQPVLAKAFAQRVRGIAPWEAAPALAPRSRRRRLGRLGQGKAALLGRNGQHQGAVLQAIHRLLVGAAAHRRISAATRMGAACAAIQAITCSKVKTMADMMPPR
jgi:hypothetical protein